MKKVVVSLFIITAFVLYGVFHNKITSTVPVLPPSTPNSFNTSTNTNTNTQSITPVTTPSTASQYKDGTYTGVAANAFYGNIQVQATINGGRITNVIFLQYPNDEDHSVRINQEADPLLAQEAIQSQNAQVDIISGATDTSEAFIQSLSSALQQAKS